MTTSARTALTALAPLTCLGTTFALGLYAVHGLSARRGADWTGLGFGEFFLWGVAAVLAVVALVALAVLLLVRATRSRPLRAAAVLSAVVALAGSAFSAAAWSIVTDGSLVRRSSTEWAMPWVTAGAVAGLLPVLVTLGWWLLAQRPGSTRPTR